MTVREICGAPERALRHRDRPRHDQAGSPTRCSRTSQAWRTRPLDAVYPIVYFDAMMVRVREDRSVAEPRLLPRAGGHLRRRARGPRHLVAGDRGREVLAGRPQRPASSRRPGRPDQLRRRPQGLPRGDRGDVPAGVGADLHRAPHPRVAALRQLPRPARRSPPRCGRSTPPRTPTQALAELDALRRRMGRSATRPPSRPGAPAGSTSSRSWRCPRTCAAPSTPPTRSRACTASSQGDLDRCPRVIRAQTITTALRTKGVRNLSGPLRQLD